MMIQNVASWNNLALSIFSPLAFRFTTFYSYAPSIVNTPNPLKMAMAPYLIMYLCMYYYIRGGTLILKVPFSEDKRRSNYLYNY